MAAFLKAHHLLIFVTSLREGSLVKVATKGCIRITCYISNFLDSNSSSDNHKIPDISPHVRGTVPLQANVVRWMGIVSQVGTRCLRFSSNFGTVQQDISFVYSLVPRYRQVEPFIYRGWPAISKVGMVLIRIQRFTFDFEMIADKQNWTRNEREYNNLIRLANRIKYAQLLFG